MGQRNISHDDSHKQEHKASDWIWENTELILAKKRYQFLLIKGITKYGAIFRSIFKAIEAIIGKTYNKEDKRFWTAMEPYLLSPESLFQIKDTVKNLYSSNNKPCQSLTVGDSIKFKDEAVNTTSPKISSKNNEFEFKFLVDPKYYNHIKAKAYLKVDKIQGYINISDDKFSQVRISKRYDRDYGLITVKTKRIGSLRQEYQYRIPSNEALEMISKCKYTIKKIRYYIKENDYEYTVDFFKGANLGLVLAEVEFADKWSMDAYQKKFDKIKPVWLKENVTNDESYYNDNIAKNSSGGNII